jgi:hypothetical protein
MNDRQKEREQKEKDWEREMREVDRLLAKLPTHETMPSPGGSGATLRRTPAAGTSAPLSYAGHRLATWARVGLGLLVGIGMTQWPYTHGCGTRLFFYLTGVVAVLAAGIWSSLSSWRWRLGVAHILSQLLIIWGLVLAAREVLPRIGYAQTEALWVCPDVAPRPAPAHLPRR